MPSSNGSTQHVDVDAGVAGDLERLRTARDRGSDADRRRAEDAVVVDYLPVASTVARRYRRRGIDYDDLEQVARIGLVKAVRRWRPDEGRLMAYLMPTIDGELKRHFRDFGTMIRVPRVLYEARPKVAAAQRELRLRLCREPTARELADATGLTPMQTEEVLQAGSACKPLSSDEIAGWIGGMASERAGEDLSMAALRTELRPAIATLTEQEQRIVGLRFVLGQSQSQIAEAVGVSQMQISRVLRSILATLRERISPVALSA